MRWLVQWVKQQLLAWLGLADTAALVSGLRTDQGAIASAAQLNALTTKKLAERMQQVATVTQSVHNRLAFYERNVPAVQKAAKSLVERMQREERKAKAEAALAAAPVEDLAGSAEPLNAAPDMSEEVAGG